VRDPNGQVVAGAVVWVGGYGEKPTVVAKTDSRGRFTLGPLPATSRVYQDLFVDTPDYARRYVSHPTVFADNDHDLGNIQLTHGKRYRGVVIDEKGTPIPHTKVEVEITRYQLGHTYTTVGAPYDIVTDSSGKFITPSLPVCHMTVSVRALEKQVAWASRSVLSGPDENLEPIKLQPDVPLIGRVQDSAGRPLAGATIQGMAGWTNLETGPDGRFTMRGLGKQRPAVGLRAWKEGYTTEMFALNQPEIVITLKKAAYILGKAVDADTGELVQLDSAQLCQFERKPDGEIIRRG
jgi:hypothetical protein